MLVPLVVLHIPLIPAKQGLVIVEARGSRRGVGCGARECRLALYLPFN